MTYRKLGDERHVDLGDSAPWCRIEHGCVRGVHLQRLEREESQMAASAVRGGVFRHFSGADADAGVLPRHDVLQSD